jgi:hypothetical protein
MRSHARLVVSLTVVLLIVAGALIAHAQSSGGGTRTQGISFFGPGSGAEFPAAGSGAFQTGSSRAVIQILLPAFSIPGSNGGQDENHVIATIRGHFPGYWIMGARITPFVSDYSHASGTLKVWLNKPANTRIPFSYLTFGIFND